MAQIIPFPKRQDETDVVEFDLLTAVDVAIRDLRDISRVAAQESVRQQADECRAMLEQAIGAGYEG